MKKILLTLLFILPFYMAAKAQDFRVGVTGVITSVLRVLTSHSPVSMLA